MEALIMWHSKNKKKAIAVSCIAQDFGLQRIAPYALAGSLKATELKDLKLRLKAVLTSRTDIFIISPLCSKCTKSLESENDSMRTLISNKFDKGYAVF